MLFPIGWFFLVLSPSPPRRRSLAGARERAVREKKGITLVKERTEEALIESTHAGIDRNGGKGAVQGNLSLAKKMVHTGANFGPKWLL
jgi:hypothetical protein